MLCNKLLFHPHFTDVLRLSDTHKNLVQTQKLPQLRAVKNFFMLDRCHGTLDWDTKKTVMITQSKGRTLMGGLGRKGRSCLLILGTLPFAAFHVRCREEAWWGGKVLCLSLSASRLLTIIIPCIRYERVSQRFDSLNQFSLSSCSQPSFSLFLFAAFSASFSLFLDTLSFSPPSPSVATWVNKHRCVGC